MGIGVVKSTCIASKLGLIHGCRGRCPCHPCPLQLPFKVPQLGSMLVLLFCKAVVYGVTAFAPAAGISAASAIALSALAVAASGGPISSTSGSPGGLLSTCSHGHLCSRRLTRLLLLQESSLDLVIVNVCSLCKQEGRPERAELVRKGPYERGVRKLLLQLGERHLLGMRRPQCLQRAIHSANEGRERLV